MTGMRIAPVTEYRPVRGLRAWLADRSPAVPGEGTRLHAGVDLAAPRGTPVLAPEDGTVVAVAQTSPGHRARAPYSGYGPEVVVIHGTASGRFHLLSHVERASVTRGQLVERGQVVAEVSNLAHVHWEVRIAERTPPGSEVVENVLSPLEWLEGRDVPFDCATMRCPSKIGPRTPKCCRRRGRTARNPAAGGTGSASSRS